MRRPPPVGLKGIGVTITPLYLLGDLVSLVKDNDDEDILLWAWIYQSLMQATFLA